METRRRGNVLEKSIPCHENRQQLGLQDQSHLPIALLEAAPFPELGGWGERKMPPGWPNPWSGITYLIRFHISKHLLCDRPCPKCFWNINCFNREVEIDFFYFNQQETVAQRG